jgi:NtrC-family two-component system sensor histidine kinase KinB
MTLKTKITLGFVAMLALLLSIGGYAFYTVRQLDMKSRDILKDNLYSVSLGQQMVRGLDALNREPANAAGLSQFRLNLTREAGNITEPGERDLVDSLTQQLAAYEQELNHDARALPPAWEPLRAQTLRMIDLNTAALTRKNELANHYAEQADRNLVLFITLAALLGLGFVASVPEAAVQPLRKLSAALAHATARDFSATIPQESEDEFGQVAQAFNKMLSELREFRTSTAAELLTARNRASSIINTLDEGLLVLDENRQIILANPVMCELLGLSPERLVGRPATIVGLENDLFQTLLKPLDAPNREQAVAEAPVLTITQRGEEAFYRLAVQNLVSFNEASDKTELVGQLLTLRNVSDFKKLDQVKSNFLATVSHEFKTPLSSINLSLKILQKDNLPEGERRDITEGIRHETQRLQRLVSELLDVSRLDSGQGIQLNFAATQLADVVQFAEATVQAQLANKQLKLHLDLPPDLPPARADVEKTTWVLINLLANAIRYSPAGESISVRAARAGKFVQVTVQDRGPGIAAEHHDKIFQRFAQLPDKAGYTGGSGLGLSIAREFITSQGGRLWVESELGSGSAFYFTLPVAG